MNPISYIIAAAILIGFVAAIFGTLRSGHGSCGSCAGCAYRNECRKSGICDKKEGL